MRLDLSLIEVFCTVYREESFSRAAAKLRLSQPTVSGHIKDLEDHLGTRLFDRLPRQVIPTRAGQILYRHGQVILQERETALQELKKFLHRMEGSLTICASTIPGEYLLPSIVTSFYQRFPAVRVDLNISDSEIVCREVLQGQAEIGFTGARLDAVGLDFCYFASDELGLIVPNNAVWQGRSAITLEELSVIPLLIREAGSGTRISFEKRIGRSLDQMNVVGCYSSILVLKEALRAGLGASILSLRAVHRELQNNELRVLPIEGVEQLRRDFYLVINKSLTMSPIAREFFNFALNYQGEQDQVANI